MNVHSIVMYIKLNFDISNVLCIIRIMRVLPQPDRSYVRKLTILENSRNVVKDEEEWDILYFIECLSKDRGLLYSDQGKPDSKKHEGRQPDRLFEDQKTKRQLAVEHTVLYSSEKDQQRLDYEIKKHAYSNGYNPPRSVELAIRLKEVIEEKNRKNQCIHYAEAEKILLMQNNWILGGGFSLFHECSQFLSLPEKLNYDHGFILLNTGSILEIF
jgi:hypothetical protein